MTGLIAIDWQKTLIKLPAAWLSGETWLSIATTMVKMRFAAAAIFPSSSRDFSA